MSFNRTCCIGLIILISYPLWAQDKTGKQSFFDPFIEEGGFVSYRGSVVLYVKGKAPLQMEGARLNFGVFYQESPCAWLMTPPLQSEKSEEPREYLSVNAEFPIFADKTRRALAGPYVVRVYFVLGQQGQDVASKIAPLMLKGQNKTVTEKSFYLGNKDSYDAEEKEIETFYATRVAYALLLRRELFINTEFGCKLPYDRNKNPFVEQSEPNIWPRALDAKAWGKWIKNWEEWLNKERQTVQKWQRSFIAPRYPKVLSVFLSLYSSMETMASTLCDDVYRINGLKVPNRKYVLYNNSMVVQLKNAMERYFKDLKEAFDFTKIEPLCQKMLDEGSQELGHYRTIDFGTDFLMRPKPEFFDDEYNEREEKAIRAIIKDPEWKFGIPLSRPKLEILDKEIREPMSELMRPYLRDWPKNRPMPPEKIPVVRAALRKFFQEIVNKEEKK